VPHFRDERRKLSIPGVDEDEERQRPQEGKTALTPPRRCFPFDADRVSHPDADYHVELQDGRAEQQRSQRRQARLEPVSQPGEIAVLDLDAERLTGQVSAQGAGVEGDIVAAQVGDSRGGEDAFHGEIAGAADVDGQAALGGRQPGEDGARVGIDRSDEHKSRRQVPSLLLRPGGAGTPHQSFSRQHGNWRSTRLVVSEQIPAARANHNKGLCSISFSRQNLERRLMAS